MLADAAGNTDRARWANKTEFLLSCVGNAVGLGNVWRFPYLCFKHGGAAFLIPYFLANLVFGAPLLFLEMAMGQNMQLGPGKLWTQVHPALSGLGFVGVSAGLVLGLYYNVIIGWSLYYLVFSFPAPLPWEDNAEKYYYHNVLQLQDAAGNTMATLEDPNGLVWPQVGFLFLSWLVVFFCVFKGIASSGKVIWFTALFPYVVLFILLIRGVMLPGASNGLRFFLVPELSKLASQEVWIDAATQIFFSVGLGFGGMVTFASYNDRQHNFVRDAWLVPLINSATSILSGLVVFSVLGHLAHEKGVDVENVAAQGPGLAFVVYPEALALFPAANFFAVMFFLMLLCLGVDSAFALAETSLTCIADFGILPRLSTGPRAALYCLLCFLLGLLFVTRGGLLWLDLFDTYATAFALFVAAAFECIGATWVYGSERLSRDILGMVPSIAGFLGPFLWHIKYVVPTILTILLGFAFQQKSTAAFPEWAIGIGWVLSFVPIAPILAVLARHFIPRVWQRMRAKPKARRPSPASTSTPEVMLGPLQGSNANV